MGKVRHSFSNMRDRFTFIHKGIPFGGKLSQVCTSEILHPRLYELMKYLYINGPYMNIIKPYNYNEALQVNLLEVALKDGRNDADLLFTPRVVYEVFKSFLQKLQDNLFDDVDCLEKRVIAYHIVTLKVQPANFKRAVLELLRFLRNVDPVTLLMMRHTFVVFWRLSLDCECLQPDPNRISQVIEDFGNTLYSASVDQSYEILSWSEIVILKFMIAYAPCLFGRKLFIKDVKHGKYCADVDECEHIMSQIEEVDDEWEGFSSDFSNIIYHPHKWKEIPESPKNWTIGTRNKACVYKKQNRNWFKRKVKKFKSLFVRKDNRKRRM